MLRSLVLVCLVFWGIIFILDKDKGKIFLVCLYYLVDVIEVFFGLNNLVGIVFKVGFFLIVEFGEKWIVCCDFIGEYFLNLEKMIVK